MILIAISKRPRKLLSVCIPKSLKVGPSGPKARPSGESLSQFQLKCFHREQRIHLVHIFPLPRLRCLHQCQHEP